MNSDYKILKEAYINKSEVKSRENYSNKKGTYIKSKENYSSGGKAAYIILNLRNKNNYKLTNFPGTGSNFQKTKLLSSEKEKTGTVTTRKDLKLNLKLNTNKPNVKQESKNLDDYTIDADLIMDDNLMSTNSYTDLTLYQLTIKTTKSADEIILTALLREPFIFYEKQITPETKTDKTGIVRSDYALIFKNIEQGTGKCNRVVKNTKAYTITYSYDSNVEKIMNFVDNINGLTLSPLRAHSQDVPKVFVNIPIESRLHNNDYYASINSGDTGANTLEFEYRTIYGSVEPRLKSFITVKLDNAKFNDTLTGPTVTINSLIYPTS